MCMAMRCGEVGSVTIRGGEIGCVAMRCGEVACAVWGQTGEEGEEGRKVAHCRRATFDGVGRVRVTLCFGRRGGWGGGILMAEEEREGVLV